MFIPKQIQQKPSRRLDLPLGLSSGSSSGKGMRPPVSGGPASPCLAVRPTLPLGAAAMHTATLREQDGNEQPYFTASEDVWSLGTLAWRPGDGKSRSSSSETSGSCSLPTITELSKEAACSRDLFLPSRGSLPSWHHPHVHGMMTVTQAKAPDPEACSSCL